MTIKIVTDSTISIEPELVTELDITIIPLSFTIDGVIYTDGDLTLTEYMAKMEATANIPKTSQPPVGVFSDIFNALTADGSEVISIHLSESLSGTVEAARQGASLSSGQVTVVDSTYIDQALGFQVVAAARLAKLGKNREEILLATDTIRKNTELYLGVANLDNLAKGGRISRVTGVISGLLDIKVVLQLRNNELSSFIKGRGNKIFKKWLDETSLRLASSGRKIKEIGISHAENLAFAQILRDSLQKFVEKPINILYTGSVIATHTGMGAWAVMIAYE